MNVARYSDEEEWADYASALIETIERGELDKYLKQIAKAAFLRAQNIGEVPKTNKPAKKSKPTLVDSPSGLETWFPVLPASSAQIASAKASGDRVVEHNGKTYLRSAFIGKQFKVRPGTYKTSQYDGLWATITGAGAKSFQVRFPSGSGPTGPGENNKGEKVFIWYNRAEYLFGK